MKQELTLDSIADYVEQNIGTFHQKRIFSLDGLKLTSVLRRKNPYLFKAKYMLTADQIIKGLVDAHISSNEETVFGDWLEGLAIFINEQKYRGRKSGIEGIDLEFESNDVKYIVTIKSGPNWGNSGQIGKMKSDFVQAKKILRTSGAKINVVAVNGCCYGRDNQPDKGEYYKYCGQRFWEFISGDPSLYTAIIEPLGYVAKERNDEFMQSYAQMINKFTREFTLKLCLEDGAIDWNKLIRYNSGQVDVKL